MAGFNKVILLGNLTRDPETSVTPGGLTICKFSLATNRRYRDRDNNEREEVTYVDIESFGKQAEILGNYLHKGSPLFVEGRLRLDSWETPAGEKRSKMKVVMENFQFIGGRNDGAESSESPAPRQSSSRSAPEKRSAPPPSDDYLGDEENPF